MASVIRSSAAAGSGVPAKPYMASGVGPGAGDVRIPLMGADALAAGSSDPIDRSDSPAPVASVLSDALIPIGHPGGEGPLAIDPSRLSNALAEAFSKSAPAPNTKLVFRAKVAGAIVSAAAKVPFANASLQVGGNVGNVPVVGIFCLIGNSVSFYILEYVAIKGTIIDVFGPKGPQEAALRAQYALSKWKKGFVVTSVLIMGAASQLPSGIAAYKYNPGWRVAAAIVTVAAGMFYPVRSMQLSFERYLVERNLTDLETKLFEMRDEMVGVIYNNQGKYISKSRCDKIMLVRQYAQITDDGQGWSKAKVMRAVQELLKHEPRALPGKRGEITKSRIMSWVGTAALVGTTLAAFARYTYDGSAFTGNSYGDIVVGATLAATTVISNTYLMVQDVSSKLYGGVSSLIAPSLCDDIAPDISAGLKLSGFAANVFGMGASFIIWSEYFNDNQGSQIYNTTTIIANMLLLVLSATASLAESYVEDRVMEKGPKWKKDLILFKREYDGLARLVRSSPLLDFALWISDLPDGYELKTTLLAKYDVTQRELSHYIEGKPIPPRLPAPPKTPPRALMPPPAPGSASPALGAYVGPGTPLGADRLELEPAAAAAATATAMPAGAVVRSGRAGSK